MERLQLEEAIQLSLALEASQKDDQQQAYQYYQSKDVDTDAFGVSHWPRFCPCARAFKLSCECRYPATLFKGSCTESHPLWKLRILVTAWR